MGIHRENGYSATVEGFFVLRGERIRLAKTNGSAFVLAEPRDLPAGTTGELLVIVDGQKDSKAVTLPEGATTGQTHVSYKVAAPF
jgi:hypothetical protein